MPSSSDELPNTSIPTVDPALFTGYPSKYLGWLTRTGHTVALLAFSPDEAMQRLQQLRPGCQLSLLYVCGCHLNCQCSCHCHLLEAPDSSETPQAQKPPQRSPLTDRERQVLAALASGMRKKDVASHLSISESTFRRVFSGTLAKLGVDSLSLALDLVESEE